MLAAAILVVLGVVLASAFVSYRSARLLARNNQLVVLSLRSIEELERAFSLVKDVETGYRGYVLTNDRAYLQPYLQATADLPGCLDNIAKLTRDNPDLQLRVRALRKLVQEKLDFSQKVVGLQQTGNHRAAVELINSNYGKETMDQLRQAFADMRNRESQLLEARTDESSRSLRQASVAFLLASLVALGFVGAFYFLARREIKERVAAARNIQDRESWLRTTLCSIGDGVIAADARGKVTFINRVAEQLIACKSAECEGRSIPEVFPIFDELTGASAPDPVAKVLAEGITELGENLVLRNHKGEEVPIEDSAAPIFGGDHRVIGVVLVFRDVTTKRMAKESARRSEKLAATGRLAATIAHEINNPLEAATNLVYLAKNSAGLSEDAKRYLDSIDHELSRAAQITRKTLSFYRDSSTPAQVNLRGLLDEVMALYASRIRAKRIRVDVESPPEVQIVAFRAELVQIISNLISNAIDALDTNGAIKITLENKKDGIKLEVEDTGPGIPAENVDRIFEAFFTTKRDVGTGLGLWVVKDLVEKQGGTVSVLSPTNQSHGGARFSVFLPCQPKSRQARETPSKAS